MPPSDIRPLPTNAVASRDVGVAGPATLADLLTIVVPTRDRWGLLELCLRSLYDRQSVQPAVIVSDNSRRDDPAVDALRRRYPFEYLRQSGQVNIVDHHNACLGMARTPWVMLLHDDDELMPEALSTVAATLTSAASAGIVIFGNELIDFDGTTIRTWRPVVTGLSRGEPAALDIGLDFQVSPPGYILNTRACVEEQGFPEVLGLACDHTLILKLAVSRGALFSRDILGRYRIGVQQTASYSTPAKAESTLDFTIGMAQLTRQIGVSKEGSDRLIDYLVWWTFLMCAVSQVKPHPFFVARLCRKCEAGTPPTGEWHDRIRAEFPFLFRRPVWVSLVAFKTWYEVRRHLPSSVLTRLRQLRRR